LALDFGIPAVQRVAAQRVWAPIWTQKSLPSDRRMGSSLRSSKGLDAETLPA
jgi:hypothetical protein